MSNKRGNSFIGGEVDEFDFESASSTANVPLVSE